MPSGYEFVTGGPTFAPLRYGLLATAYDVPTPDQRWRRGIRRTPDICADADAMLVACVSGTGSIPAAVTGVGSVTADTFQVFAWVDCGPVGVDLDEVRRRGTQLLTSVEGRAAEHVFWTGETVNGTVYPHLASDAVVSDTPQGASVSTRQTAATEVTSAAVDVVEALGLVEAELATCYGGEGVVHVPAQAVAHLGAWNLIEREGELMRTLYGNRVAIYSSNDRSGPDGVVPADGLGWIYGTGAVSLRRSPVLDYGARDAEIMDRAKNDAVYLVGRYYNLSWDCCHVAAQVSLGGAATGDTGGA